MGFELELGGKGRDGEFGRLEECTMYLSLVMDIGVGSICGDAGLALSLYPQPHHNRPVNSMT